MLASERIVASIKTADACGNNKAAAGTHPCEVDAGPRFIWNAAQPALTAMTTSESAPWRFSILRGSSWLDSSHIRWLYRLWLRQCVEGEGARGQ